MNTHLQNTEKRRSLRFKSMPMMRTNFRSMFLAVLAAMMLLANSGVAQTAPTVYVCGTDENNRAAYWKDGTKYLLTEGYGGANSIFVSDNDVYVAGYGNEDIGGGKYKTIARLWKNGEAMPISIYAQLNYSVFWNECAIHNIDGTYLNTVFPTTLPPTNPSITIAATTFSRASSVYVSNGKVYMAGSLLTGTQNAVTHCYTSGTWPNFQDVLENYEVGPFYSTPDKSAPIFNYTADKAACWIDGQGDFAFNDNNSDIIYDYHTANRWGKTGSGSSVFVSGNDVYVAGGEFDGSSTGDGIGTLQYCTPALWKNGEYVPLPHVDKVSAPGRISTASSVFVSPNGDVYVLINESYREFNDNGNMQTFYDAKLWKNDTVTDLGSGQATSVYVSGNDVYVSGGISGGYWKNGERIQIASVDWQGNRTARNTNSIFVQGNDVYVAGSMSGYYFDEGQVRGAAYWKNGEQVILCNGGSYSTATGIFVVGDGNTDNDTNTVTFAGESISIEPQKVLAGELAVRPPDPERTNYDFGGWFTDNITFLNEWNFATDVVTQDTTLWAKWSETAGIIEMASESIKIYPNPAKDELIIESGELKIESVEIVDITGKKQFSIFNFQFSTINVSHLSAGTYFVKIKTDKGELTTKFIKN